VAVGNSDQDALGTCNWEDIPAVVPWVGILGGVPYVVEGSSDWDIPVAVSRTFDDRDQDGRHTVVAVEDTLLLCSSCVAEYGMFSNFESVWKAEAFGEGSEPEERVQAEC